MASFGELGIYFSDFSLWSLYRTGMWFESCYLHPWLYIGIAWNLPLTIYWHCLKLTPDYILALLETYPWLYIAMAWYLQLLSHIRFEYLLGLYTFDDELQIFQWYGKHRWMDSWNWRYKNRLYLINETSGNYLFYHGQTIFHLLPPCFQAFSPLCMCGCTIIVEIEDC